ncbi:MAG TPA: catalase, partial [Methanocella sp.]|nr:catalase [Methanocella sp.]
MRAGKSKATGKDEILTAKNNAMKHFTVSNQGQTLTSNLGVKVGMNNESLKAGLRGPTLLEDFIFREKITHFDHERIP